MNGAVPVRGTSAGPAGGDTRSASATRSSRRITWVSEQIGQNGGPREFILQLSIGRKMPIVWYCAPSKAPTTLAYWLVSGVGMGVPGVTHTFHFTFGKLFGQSTL